MSFAEGDIENLSLNFEVKKIFGRVLKRNKLRVVFVIGLFYVKLLFEKGYVLL